jgi:HEAT repeat protein
VDHHGRRLAAGSTTVQVEGALPGIQHLLADLVGPDEIAAEASVAALAGEGEAAVRALRELLGSADPDQRWWALRALAAFPDPPVQVFIECLGDRQAEVRSAAALALAEHPDPRSLPALVKLLGDEDDLAALLAVRAVARLGESAIPSLINAFESAPQKGQIHMLRAFAELRDPRSIGLLMRALDGTSALMQYWAQQALQRLGMDMVYLRPD